MKTFLPAIATSALLFGSVLAAAPEETRPKAPDAKAGTRLKFQAYDGDWQKPKTMTFQVGTLDLRQPAVYLQIGEIIPNTKFKLTHFFHRERKNAETSELDDVSELVIMNAETRQTFVLALDKIVLAR